MRRGIRPLVDLAVAAFRTWPLGVLLSLLYTPLVSVAGPVSALALGRLVDAVVVPHVAPVLVWLTVFILSSVGIDLFTGLGEYSAERLDEMIQQEVTQRLMRSALSAPGLEHLESQRYADRLQTVQSNPHAFAGLLNLLRATVGNVGGVVIAAAALGRVHPLLVIWPLAAGLVGLMQLKLGRWQLRYSDLAATPRRLANAYFGLATGAGAAKEVRLFDLGGYLERGFLESSRAALRLEGRTKVLEAALGSARALAYAGTLGGGAAFLVWLAAHHQATPGNVAMGVAMLRGLLDSATNVSYSIGHAGRSLEVATRYGWLIDYRSPVLAPASPHPVPPRLTDGLRLEGLSFHYPGSDRPVLDQLTFRMPAGKTVALVGENGAGKTTLVKLLCRFYDPAAGAILVDGVDLREMDLEQWRRRTTGAFQDFSQFHFLLRESIGLGAIEDMMADPRVRDAADRADALDVVDGLPEGLATQLGKEFPGGTELSVGQWQKVSLARGFMRMPDGAARRESPLLLLLDEPTASLDPRAEASLFDRFAEVTETARKRGAVALIVSHRFSTVRLADHIVVMGGGRLREQGSHDELMRLGGLYRELYQLQADKYRA